MKRYKVHVSGKRYAYFATIEAATKFCSEVFRKTSVVLSIVEVK